MKTRSIAVGIGLLALLTGAAAWVMAEPAGQPTNKAVHHEEAGEKVIPFAQAPEAVRAAALKLMAADGEKAIRQVIKEEDDDTVTYEVEYTVTGVNCSAIFSTAGDLMELEKGIKEATLPAALLASIRKEFPNASIGDPNFVQRFYYEIDLTIDGKTREIKIDAAGDIQDDGDRADERHKHVDRDDDGDQHEAHRHGDDDQEEDDD